MRIRDWSSDVCSSDLSAAGTGPGCTSASTAFCAAATSPCGGPRSGGYAGREATKANPKTTRGSTSSQPEGDSGRVRKSGVQGKRVSVRGDFGGGSILKKQTNTNKCDTKSKPNS